MENSQSRSKLVVFVGLTALAVVAIFVWWLSRNTSKYIPKKTSYHFDEFKKVFNEVFEDNSDYIYSKKNTALDEATKKKYNDMKDELLPLLQAIMYGGIDSCFFIPEDLSKKSLFKFNGILTVSKDKEIKDFNIRETKKDKERAETMFKKILKDPDVLKLMPFSHENIQNLRAISLASFKFDTLPNVFEVFESLESIFFEDTNVSDLEPLNKAKNIRIIYAENNKITAIEGLKDLTKLVRISFIGNNIKDIESDFITNHPNIQYGGIILSPKSGFVFSKEIEDAIKASNGKIIKITPMSSEEAMKLLNHIGLEEIDNY